MRIEFWTKRRELPLSPVPSGERAEAGLFWPAEGAGRRLVRCHKVPGLQSGTTAPSPGARLKPGAAGPAQAAAPHPNPLPVPATGRTGRGEKCTP